MGSTVMRLADADLLPFDFSNFADTMKKYIGDVQKLLKTQQDAIHERNQQLEEGVFAAVSDPQEPVLPPPVLAPPPYFNFAPLQNASEKLDRSADRFNAAWKKAQSNGEMDLVTIKRINHLLMQSGPKLTDPAGLPGRPWFKNQIYAPGAYTGYDAKPLPGVLEAMDRKDWKEAESQIPRAAQALERETALIDEITAALEAAKPKLGSR